MSHSLSLKCYLKCKGKARTFGVHNKACHTNSAASYACSKRKKGPSENVKCFSYLKIFNPVMKWFIKQFIKNVSWGWL